MASGLDGVVVAATYPESPALARGSAGAVSGREHPRNTRVRTSVAKCARSFNSPHASLRRERGSRCARGRARRTLRDLGLNLGGAAHLAGGDFERPRNSASGPVSLAQVSRVWSLAHWTHSIPGRPVRHWFAFFLCRPSAVAACVDIMVALALLVGDSGVSAGHDFTLAHR